MIKNRQAYRIVQSAAKLLKERGFTKDGYFMLREPQIFCLVPKNNRFDISVNQKVWKKGTQLDQVADIALSLMGCNISDTVRLKPMDVKTETAPDRDYKMWKQNFKRCYSDLKALKGSDSSKVNACVFTMVHPILFHKPCIIYIQFGTYGKKLQLIVNARATHLFMLYENLLRYSYLQLLFSSLLDFSLGEIFFMSNNFHVLSDQKRSLSGYLNLSSDSVKFLTPDPLTLKDYHSDRRKISSGNYESIKWDVFKNLVNQRKG